MRSLTILMLAAVATAGCSFYPGAEATLPAGPMPANEGSPGFFDRISSQTHVTEDDGMRGMFLLLTGEDKAKTFDQRVTQLQQRGVVAAGWRNSATSALTRGKLAYMIYQACGVPGGLMLHVTGPSQRYCLKELQYRGMMGKGTSTSRVTGLELVAVLTRADAYLQSGEAPELLETGGS